MHARPGRRTIVLGLVAALAGPACSRNAATGGGLAPGGLAAGRRVTGTSGAGAKGLAGTAGAGLNIL